MKSAAREIGTKEAHCLPLGNLYFYLHNIEGPLKFNLRSNIIIMQFLKIETPLFLPYVKCIREEEQD